MAPGARGPQSPGHWRTGPHASRHVRAPLCAQATCVGVGRGGGPAGLHGHQPHRVGHRGADPKPEARVAFDCHLGKKCVPRSPAQCFIRSFAFAPEWDAFLVHVGREPLAGSLAGTLPSPRPAVSISAPSCPAGRVLSSSRVSPPWGALLSFLALRCHANGHVTGPLSVSFFWEF